MGILDWFHKKSCAEHIDALEGLLLTIAKYPEKSSNEQELMTAAKAIASRCAKILSKVEHLDKTTADALRGKLYFIENPSTYSAMRVQAQVGMEYVLKLNKLCAGKVQRKEQSQHQTVFERGEEHTYARIMSKKELGCTSESNELSCGRPNAPVPAIIATEHQKEFFRVKGRSKALRDIYSLMDGSGSPDFVVIFTTTVVPTNTGASRYPKLINVKFPAGTPIKIVETRKI